MNRRIYRYAGSEWLAQDQQRVYEKLSEDDVIDIRIKYAEGGVSYGQLGKEYGVSGRYIGDILWELEFQHVPITPELQRRIEDARARNTHSGGRKLTDEEVCEIRQLLVEDRLSMAEISRRYGVHRDTARNILIGKTYNDVPIEPELGRKLDNVVRKKKGRTQLTESNVKEVRYLYSKKHLTTTAIAKMYDVSRNIIYCVVTGRTWKHVI